MASTGTSGVVGQPDFNQMEVCKVYSGITGPAVTIAVTVDVGDNGSIDLTLPSVTLTNGQCVEINHSAPVGAPVGDRIHLTEQVPAGYTATWTRRHTSGATNSGTGNTANGAVHFDGGWLITFTNTSNPVVQGEGRFTGGGNLELANGIVISTGLTMHCDLILSNNLNVVWKDLNDVNHHFHLEEHLTTVGCTDAANINQPPPDAPLDTMIGTGIGKFDNTDGYSIQFTFVDGGEGSNAVDRISLRIFLGNTVVLNTNGLVDVIKGNLQAHFEQPHK